jgi:hypothetical protein
MAGLTVAAGDLFDGYRWLGPSTLTVAGGEVVSVEPGAAGAAGAVGGATLRADAVLPGLVDWGVSAVGYADTPLVPHPFAAETAFARMCLRWGVTTVVDVANAPAPLAHLGELARRGAGPRLVHAGGRLCSEPTGRCDVLVDEGGADRAVAANELLGAALVSAGRLSGAGVRTAVVKAAAARGIPLVLSRQEPRETPGLLVAAELAGPGVPAVPGFGEPVGEPGRWWYAPQLEAAARWTVDGLLAATDAALAAPFLPYARNFGRVKGFLGRRIGRDVLRGYYGDRAAADLGAGRERLAAAQLAAGTCLASSGAGATGLVPGLSLWAELDRLAALPGPDGRAPAGPDAALAAATGVAGGLLPGRTGGVLTAGRPADLLLCDGVRRGAAPGELRAGLVAVVRDGVCDEVAVLAREVEAMVAEACREGP